MKKLISIITVCFNETSEKINETFNSILEQDYHSIEFIVIDGNSSSETINAIKPYLNSIDHYVSEPDNGIFDAMNKGLMLANGTWVCFMNVGDSFYKNDVLSNLFHKYDGISEIIYGNVFKKKLGLVYSPKKLNKYIFYDSGICHQSMLIKTSIFNNIGFFDLNVNLYGDADWVMNAFINDIKFNYINEIVSNYEGGGVSSNASNLKNDRKQFLKKYFSLKEIIFYFIYSSLNKALIRVKRLLRMNFFYDLFILLVCLIFCN
jgi:glycosyltransferase involved in cell wall biosynthesis